MDEVVWRPGAGELHLTVLEQFARGGELILVSLHAFCVDQMRDIQQHLAIVHGAAGDLFILWHEEALHLDGDGATLGLPLALSGSGLTQVGEVFLADALSFVDSAERLRKTAVLDRDLEVHFGFAAQALYMRCVLALIRALG